MDEKSFNIRIPHKWVRLSLVVLVTTLIVAPLTAIASHSFTDVPNSNIFHADIEWLKDAGVTRGCNPPNNTQYCPKDPVTREAMAAFMRRFAQYLGAEDGTPAQADNASFLDGKSASHYEGRLDALGNGSDWLGLLEPGVHTLRELDITAPEAGAVLIQGSASWLINTGEYHVDTWIELDTAAPCDAADDGDRLPASSSLTSIGVETFYGTTLSVAPVDIISAGSHTAYLCALVIDSTPGDPTVSTADPIVQVMFSQWFPSGTITTS